MEKLRLLVVDDHPIIAEGLPIFLGNYPDIVVVGTASDGLEGLAQLRALDPDFVVVDMSLPKLGGGESIRLYLQEKPGLGIVVYTGHKEEVFVYQALQAGARGYVLKGSPVSELVSAIREVQRGGYWVSAELNPAIIRSYLKYRCRENDELAEFNNLSEREKQVFLLLANGKPTLEVGTTLHISPKTVAKHKVAIMHKLKVKNAAEMAIYAMRIGLGPAEC